MWYLDERHRLFRKASTEPVQLTSSPIRWGTPIPSKDGKRIYARGAVIHGELVRYDLQSRQFQPYLGGISAEFVAFSPDGKSLAYVTFPEGILWRVNRDGSNPVRLTDPPFYPKVPRWSPDGSQILFFDRNAEGRLQAFVMPSQGGTPRPLIAEYKEPQSDPNWSPDGSKVVYASQETGSGTTIRVIRRS
jgi:Tol biopolymer transport system component